MDAAQADGGWGAAYAGQGSATMPADLETAITANPAAQAMLDMLSSTNRYALIYRVNDVKRAVTWDEKIARFVAMLERGETPYPQ